MTDPDHHAMMEEHASYGRRIQDLEIEIEELRAENERLRDAKEYSFNELTTVRAEVERLRTDNAELQKQKDYWQKLAISRALEPKP